MDLLVRMAHNNAWANLRLHDAVAQLDDAAYLSTARTSFFPSIHLTLAHILFVDLYYLDALEGHPRPWSEHDLARAALWEQQQAADQRLIANASLDPDATITMSRAAGPQTDSRTNVLLHLYQHQVHHRGQVHAMLSGTPVAPPQLDEFFMKDELPLREAELRRLGLPLV